MHSFVLLSYRITDVDGGFTFRDMIASSDKQQQQSSSVFFFLFLSKMFHWEEGKENFMSGSIARAQRRRIGFDQLTEKRPMTEKKIGFGRMSRFCDNSISFLISCCFDNSEKDRFWFRWQPWHWTGDFAPSFRFTNFTEKIFSWLRHSLSSEEKNLSK